MKLCVFVISVLFIASAFAVQSFPEELKETVYVDLEAEKGTLQKKVRPKSDIFSVTHNQRWFHCMFCNPRRRLIRSIEMPTPCNLSITISLSVVKSHITMFVTAHQPLPVGSVYQPP